LTSKFTVSTSAPTAPHIAATAAGTSNHKEVGIKLKQILNRRAEFC
jgi:hypothetical protein